MRKRKTPTIVEVFFFSTMITLEQIAYIENLRNAFLVIERALTSIVSCCITQGQTAGESKHRRRALDIIYESKNEAELIVKIRETADIASFLFHVKFIPRAGTSSWDLSSTEPTVNLVLELLLKKDSQKLAESCFESALALVKNEAFKYYTIKNELDELCIMKPAVPVSLLSSSENSAPLNYTL